MQLFIPEKIKVGFQKRSDTYTGNLAYVIYYDQTGKLRKEASWNSWKSKDIEPIELLNKPREGFVLNKNGGGKGGSYSWNTRNAFIRVYDPSDFEFEISVANLLFILRECNCSKGKGLEGKFVYSWEGTELVLLPEKCVDYQNSLKFTALQNQGVKAKDLIIGASYITKKQQSFNYIGRLDYYDIVHNYRSQDIKEIKVKKWVFWDGKTFEYLNDLKSIASLVSDTKLSNYAEILDQYNKSSIGSKIVALHKKRVSIPTLGKNSYEDYYNTHFTEIEPGVFRSVERDHNYNIKTKDYTYSYYLSNKLISCIDKNYMYRKISCDTNLYNYSWNRKRDPAITVCPTKIFKILVELESGSKFEFDGYNIGSKIND